MIYTRVFDTIFFLDNFDVIFLIVCVNRFVSAVVNYYYVSMSDVFISSNG